MDQELRVVSSAAEISRIAADWRALVDACGHVALNDPEWYANAAQFTHAQADQLSIMTLWRAGQLVALAPLVRAARPGGARYEIIGSRVLYEPAEILVRDAQAAQRMAVEIARLGRPVLLSRLPAGSAFHDAFSAHARRTGWILSPHSSGSAYVELNGRWESYYETLPSKTRNMLRRAHRALSKLGRVELECIRPDPDALPALLPQAFEVERHSWKGRAGSAVLQRPDLLQFFHHYAHEAAARNELLVSFMRFDGMPIAMQVANVGRNAYWQLKIGYDERHSKYLPGLQLLLETIRWSFEHRLATYEFLGTAEPWIAQWTDKVRDHKTTLFYPFNVAGIGALLHDSCERVRRKLPFRRAAGS